MSNYMKAQEGQIYQYEIRASGGPSMKPLKSLGGESENVEAAEGSE
ncbi:MAG: hypothetical protein R3C03_08930 [Pirellulaceae bacterium]